MSPPFDQAAVDQRFLEEVYRLHAAKSFATFTELAGVLQTHRGIISELEAGRYHCNLKLLYLLHAAYQVDVMYVLTGQNEQARPPTPARPNVSAGRPGQPKSQVHQVPSFEEFKELRKEVQELRAELAHYRAAFPEWLQEAEAQQLTGLSQATLARERKKPATLLVWKSTGGLRYLRSSILAYNEARSIRKPY